jgi:predicted ferric reductase
MTGRLTQQRTAADPVIIGPAGAGPSPHRVLADRVVNALGLGGAFVAMWPLVAMVLGGAGIDPVALIGHVSGMLAGYGVLVMLVLMSRWPVLEGGVGADVLARWHARGGRTVLTLVLIHAVFAVLAWSLLAGLDPVTALARVMTWPGLPAATIGTAMLVAVAIASARSARTKMRWETWHLVHLSTYVAVALSFVHQLGGPDLAGRPWLQAAWGLLYAWTFALVLRYRVLTPLQAAFRHRLRVIAVIPEAHGVVSIVISGRHLEELAPQPGQFFRWRFLTSGSWGTAHPFSLSAPPVGNRLRLTVKSLGDGSERLQQVPVGTRVVAEGPYGAMTADRRTRRDVLLVAGGVGITPMRALFETIPTAPGQDLMLLYRATSPEEIVFREELDALAARRQARVVYLLGRSRELLSARSFTRLVPGLTDRDVYLCGPPGMAAAVRGSLAEAGVPSEQLHEERFAL